MNVEKYLDVLNVFFINGLSEMSDLYVLSAGFLFLLKATELLFLVCGVKHFL
jgi:hypothetical protein